MSFINMGKNIIIYDVIGQHCGMHYYDEAFAELLKNESRQVKVCSNFSNKTAIVQTLPNFFLMGKIKRLFLMTWYAIKLFFYALFHQNSTIIYLWYGETYDLLFGLCSLVSKNVWLDVHEVHALKYTDGSKISKFFESYFKHIVRKVIYHSDRTKDMLSMYQIKMLYVPHFKYGFQKDYVKESLPEEVSKCFKSGFKKFLFFGNLTVVKGIDTVTEVFNQIATDGDAFELVIAGKNVNGFDFSPLKGNSNITIIDRHITDDELVYLYSNTDYVLLPYKKSSQSGILAMSAYFKKPMILSDIPYFKSVIDSYPSFGITAPIEDFYTVIKEHIANPRLETFFTKEDCDSFEMKKEFDAFVKEFGTYI